SSSSTQTPASALSLKITPAAPAPRRRASPHLPRRSLLLPQRVEVQVVAVGVHRVPEPLVHVDRELSVARQAAQRLLLEEELRVVVEVVQRLALEDEEAARDEPLRDRLLGE